MIQYQDLTKMNPISIADAVMRVRSLQHTVFGSTIGSYNGEYANNHDKAHTWVYCETPTDVQAVYVATGNLVPGSAACPEWICITDDGWKLQDLFLAPIHLIEDLTEGKPIPANPRYEVMPMSLQKTILQDMLEDLGMYCTFTEPVLEKCQTERGISPYATQWFNAMQKKEPGKNPEDNCITLYGIPMDYGYVLPEKLYYIHDTLGGGSPVLGVPVGAKAPTPKSDITGIAIETNADRKTLDLTICFDNTNPKWLHDCIMEIPHEADGYLHYTGWDQELDER